MPLENHEEGPIYWPAANAAARAEKLNQTRVSRKGNRIGDHFSGAWQEK